MRVQNYGSESSITSSKCKVERFPLLIFWTRSVIKSRLGLMLGTEIYGSSIEAIP